MNLIDRDAIPWAVDGVGEIPVVTKEEIEAMPVVDAIPIEFIMQRCEMLRAKQFIYNDDELLWRMYASDELSLNLLMIAWAKRKEE